MYVAHFMREDIPVSGDRKLSIPNPVEPDKDVVVKFLYPDGESLEVSYSPKPDRIEIHFDNRGAGSLPDGAYTVIVIG